MKRQYLHRHHRQTLLVTGITDMLLNANATSGAEIFAVETHELMANKTPQQLMWGSLGGIFILMLIADYWHWYVGIATVHRWWSSLILLLLLFGAIGGTLFIPTIRDVARPLFPVGMRLVFQSSLGNSQCLSRVNSRHPLVVLLGSRGIGLPLLPLLSQSLY